MWGCFDYYPYPQLCAFCQATTQKATAPVTKKTNPDVWQRSKECAAQADQLKSRKDGVLFDYEKIVRDYAASLSGVQALGAFLETAKSGKATTAVPVSVQKGFINHYSPKYGVCFIRASYTLKNVVPKVGEPHPFDRTTAMILVDAFGGGLLADLDFHACYIAGKSEDCVETQNKINDAMDN